MKDGRHDEDLQPLTPQKRPVSFGASGTRKGTSCKF